MYGRHKLFGKLQPKHGDDKRDLCVLRLRDCFTDTDNASMFDLLSNIAVQSDLAGKTS